MDGHQRGRHAGEELHGADETLGAHQRQQHAEPEHRRGGCAHREQAEAEAYQ